MMNDTSRLICEIVKSSRRDEMYLYLDKARGMAHSTLVLELATPGRRRQPRRRGLSGAAR